MEKRTINQVQIFRKRQNYVVFSEGISDYSMNKQGIVSDSFHVEKLLYEEEYLKYVSQRGYTEIRDANMDYHPFLRKDILAYKEKELFLREKYKEENYIPEETISLYRKLAPSEINSFYQMYIYKGNFDR